jgi:uncharacterized protein YbaP (TraB family)
MSHLIANPLLQRVAGYFQRQAGRSSMILPIVCCLFIAPLQAALPQGVLYQFHKPGGEIHYLFGTMHATDPRVIGMLNRISEPLAKSQQLVMEMVPDVTAMIHSSASMMLPPGQTLQQLLGDELYGSVLAAVTDKGLTDPVLQRLKPWAVAVTISLPELDGKFLDQRIYQLALENDQPVYGLESAAEQLAVFDSLPQSLQIRMLRETLDQLPRLPAMLEAMIKVYVAGDLVKLQQLTLEYELSSSDRALADWFKLELVINRNIRMAERLESLLEKGGTFVAVGALHLVDDSGLIQALMRAGYQVEPI